MRRRFSRHLHPNRSRPLLPQGSAEDSAQNADQSLRRRAPLSRRPARRWGGCAHPDLQFPALTRIRLQRRVRRGVPAEPLARSSTWPERVEDPLYVMTAHRDSSPYLETNDGSDRVRPKKILTSVSRECHVLRDMLPGAFRARFCVFGRECGNQEEGKRSGSSGNHSVS